jgi:ferrous iron transport protein A
MLDKIVQVRLDELRPGQRARVITMSSNVNQASASTDLMERLLEMGFAEGSDIEMMHEGPFGRDPMAVKVDGVIIALRRKEAATVAVEVQGRS